MGRGRRHISEDGIVVCKYDPNNWHGAHYTEFYGWNREPLDYWYDQAEDIWIGKLDPWCADCKSRYNKSRYRPRTREADPREAVAIAEYRRTTMLDGPEEDVQVIKERAGKMGPPADVLDGGVAFFAATAEDSPHTS